MLRNSHLFRSMQRLHLSRFNYSSDSSKKNLSGDVVIIAEDMVVCWHPEPKFPYECSKPLPLEQPESPAVLKMSLDQAHEVFARKKDLNLVAEELAKLTYTTKHIWFPRSRDKKAKKTEPDRTYL